MKKINLLYVSSSLGSIHEYRFLKKISEDVSINLIVATCEPKMIYDKILELELCIIKSPEANFTVNIPVLRGLTLEYRHYRFISFLKKIIQEYKIDLIHSGWLTLDTYDALKTGFHPVLGMSWGSDVLDNPYVENPHNSKRLFFKLNYVARNADAIYCDAKHVADVLCSLTGISNDKIRVFPQLGIDTTVFKPDVNLGQKIRLKHNIIDKNVLIMTRQMLDIYGIEYFIRALNIVVEKYPNTVAIVSGNGPLEKDIKQLVKDLNIQSNVIFTGFLPNHELPAYFNAADIYVSTSLSDGTSLALMEAMSCALPAVITDVPSNLEWIRDGFNGFIALRANVNSIADSIIRALKDKDALVMMGNRNRNIATERIDLNSNYMKLSLMYREILWKIN